MIQWVEFFRDPIISHNVFHVSSSVILPSYIIRTPWIYLSKSLIKVLFRLDATNDKSFDRLDSLQCLLSTLSLVLISNSPLYTITQFTHIPFNEYNERWCLFDIQIHDFQSVPLLSFSSILEHQTRIHRNHHFSLETTKWLLVTNSSHSKCQEMFSKWFILESPQATWYINSTML